ncbi:MAG: alpha/beta fold hydrolase [Jiangellales bacterium]
MTHPWWDGPVTYDATELIPRDILFGNPERAGAALSPDGTRIGFLAPVDGVMNVWVGPLDDPSAAKPVTADRGHGVRVFVFAHDDRTLLYLRDSDGDENWRLYTLDLQTGESTLRTPGEGVTAAVLSHNRWHPTTVLVGLNADNPQLHDVYSLDLVSGELTKVQTNPGFAGWLVDSEQQVRGGAAMTQDGGVAVLLRDESGEFVPWRQIGPEDVASTNVLGYTRDGSAMLLSSSEGVNAGRLVRLDLATGVETVLAEDPTYDVSGMVTDPETLEPLSVVFDKERDEWVHLDASFGVEIDALRARLAGDFGISRDRANRTWLVTESLSDGPVRYYRYDRDTRDLGLLFVHKPALERYDLAPMEPFAFTSRDGLTVHGYVTYPLGVERTGLPAVLNVHGGPWHRDSWGYNPEAQWLANRGYACVQVNFRGSTGYGKAFLNAGDREWGAAMHDDLLDAVEHLVSAGTIDRARVGIYGGSYGGYAALVGAAFTPDVFRCAVDMVGPSNLSTLIESVPEYWQPQIALFHTKVGNPETEAEFLWSRSPLSRVDDIVIPILIAQGKNDPRVKEAEAQQIVDAMAAKGLPYEYLLFDDEGHGLVRPENRERFYAAAEFFLAAHLGGRAE